MARRGRRTALAGAALLVALAAGGLAAPRLAPHDPYATALADRLAPARAGHPLGQDTLGRDVLARVLAGARISLAVGAAAVAISLVLGAGVGLVAGYAGGWVDEALARVIDVLLAFPGLLLAIALASVLGPGLGRLVVQAIDARDYPLVQGCVLVIGASYVAVNTLTDVAHRLLDPRLRDG